MKLWVASKNLGKLREFRDMLQPLGISVHGAAELADFEVEEDGNTFLANAIKKAQALVAKTGEPAVADDSGLVVDALGGAPGVHSARYAELDQGAKASGDQDANNRKKLLGAMRAIPDGERSARFVCTLAYLEPGSEPRVFTGTLEGRIGHTERGDGGFGYDPLFVVTEGPNAGKTAAELAPQDKHAISHRGKALRALLAWMSKRGL